MENEKLITEKSEVIAVFMGWTIELGMEGKKNPYYNWSDGWNMSRPSEMKFDSDWNWLMAVVSKINKTPNPKTESTTFSTKKTDLRYYVSLADMENSFIKVYEIIDWYNENI